MKKKSSLTRSLLIVLAVVLVIIVYAYGFEVTKVNFEETRSERRLELIPLLAEELRSASTAGTAMRLVRILASWVGSHFSFEPGGNQSERSRVADLFIEWWEQAGSPR